MDRKVANNVPIRGSRVSIRRDAIEQQLPIQKLSEPQHRQPFSQRPLLEQLLQSRSSITAASKSTNINQSRVSNTITQPSITLSEATTTAKSDEKLKFTDSKHTNATE